MLEKTQSLSNKIKIIVGPEKLGSFSQNHVTFYMKYSSFVFRSLKRPSFQRFIYWMLRRENIEEQMVRAVDVKVFPLRRKNGKGLAGNCDTTRGKIRIYPKTVKFCRVFTQKFGKNNLLVYAGSRARAALIHELLHLKYATDEEKVRELAEDYFFAFTQNKPTNSSHSLVIYTMLFRVKKVEKPSKFLQKKKENIAGLTKRLKQSRFKKKS
jgi:hypothetical protein